MSSNLLEVLSPGICMTQLRRAAQLGADRWFATLTPMVQCLGFRDVVFAMRPTSGTAWDEAFFRSTCTSAWRRICRDDGCAGVAPLLAYANDHAVPLVWRAEHCRGEMHRALYQHACAQGLRTGVVLPMHGPGAFTGILCVAMPEFGSREVLRRISQTLPSLTLLRDAAQESARRFVERQADDVRPKLTARERECMHWVAHGKSSWEISRICGCSEATVNFHMGNVRRKFGVTSRSEATVKALAMGLLDWR